MLRGTYRRTNIRVVRRKGSDASILHRQGGLHGYRFYQLAGRCRCVVVAMISGFIWYHPKLFYPGLGEGIGRSAEPSDPNPMIYVFTLIAALVQAAPWHLMVNAAGEHDCCLGALDRFHAWLGFVAPTNLVNKLFAGQGSRLGHRDR